VDSFKHILCPVDFSELSALGLRYAGALAKCNQAKLTILYANSFLPPPYFTKARIEELQEHLRDSFAEAQKSLRHFSEAALGPGRPNMDNRVAEGLPVDAIRLTATEVGADLIVMGTHGRSGVNRLMLGSVTERVLRESAIPVLTVRGAEHSSSSFKEILCAVNDTEVSRQALRLATRIGECFGGAVTVLHVRESVSENSIEDVCGWISPEDRAHCTVRELTREGHAAKEIVALARERPSDLLVIGSQHRRFFDATVLGATTARVVRHAPCPVLTVPEA
jgi:nucleotide-binding universal stress UspA family protein